MFNIYIAHFLYDYNQIRFTTLWGRIRKTANALYYNLHPITPPPSPLRHHNTGDYGTLNKVWETGGPAFFYPFLFRNDSS